MSLTAAFKDFVLTTRNEVASDPNSILNDAQKYPDYLIRDLLAGREKEMFQGGAEIEEYLELDPGAPATDYSPTDVFSYTNVDTLTKVKVPWRFTQNYYTWTEQEILLSSGAKVAMKNLHKAKKQGAYTSIFDKLEDSLVATPETAQMETSTGRTPYSLRCFITDNGNAPTSLNGGVTGADWTTVSGVNPTDKPYWKNQVSTYDGTSATTVRDTILKAMDKCWLKTGFRAPTNSQEYFTDSNMRRMKIIASTEGVAYMSEIARSANDRLTPAGDVGWSVGNVTFHGIPIKYVPALDTVDATPDAAGKPKYRFVNLNHFKLIFHPKKFMTIKDVTPAPNQPHVNLVLFDTYRQLMCTSRRRQGIVLAA